METVRPRLTFADLERMPDDGRRYELYDGEVVVVPSPLLFHQIVLARLTDSLRGYGADHGGLCVYAPLDIVFSDYDVLQPDIVYFRPERRALLDPRKVIRIAPDLCVEVLSPSTAKRDRGAKMHIFARFHVQEYWIADPQAASIEAYDLTSDRYRLRATVTGTGLLTSAVLPGLTIPVQEIFQKIV